KPAIATAVMAVGMWCPGLSALVVTRFVLREPLATTTINRLGRRRYYLWAWFLPLAGTLAAMGLTVLLGCGQFDPEFNKLQAMMEASGRSVPVPPWFIVLAQMMLALTVGPLFNALFAVGEELGWRGFLLPRLMISGVRQWPALIVTGIVWGIWH